MVYVLGQINRNMLSVNCVATRAYLTPGKSIWCVMEVDLPSDLGNTRHRLGLVTRFEG